MALYIPITNELRQKLISERKRTGIGPTALMRGTAHDPERPTTLKGHTISLWLSGKIVSARRSQLDYVLERWAALPDADQASARRPQERVTLTDEHLSIIDEAWSDGLLPDKVLQHPDAPDGLNAAIIRTWKDRRIKSAAKTYLDFVMAQCAKASVE
ncbi:hypothetical protein ACR9YC_12725 [Parasphingorhabdus sp. DH2-15]|uniref:hypothetical protein n=1 Tax=Parasphingorhabdus sp. DH2-15 TaxID=3444112 RepID=UPI003F682629